MRSTTGALAAAALLGLSAGLGLAVWPAAFARALADTPGTAITLGVIAAVAFALGTGRDQLRAGAAANPGRSAGVRMLALGALTIAVGRSNLDLARFVATVGVDLDSSLAALTIARAIVGGLFVVPAALAAGTVVRLLARELPEESAAGRAAATAVLGCAIGWTTAWWIDVPAASLALPRGPERAEIVTLAGALLLGAGALVALRSRGREGRTRAAADVAADPAGALGLSPAWSGFGVALALTAFPIVGQRMFAAVVGNDLPGLSPAFLAFGVGVTFGALVAAIVAPRLPGRAVPGWGAALVAVSATAAVVVYGRFGSLPATFHAGVAPARTIAEALGVALALSLPRLGLIAFPLGAAAVLVANRLPAARSSRNRWVARATAGAAAGAVVGLALPRLGIPSLGLGPTAALAALAAVVPATIAAIRGGLPGVTRVLLALIGTGIVAAAAARMPAVDRDALIVERKIRSEASMISGVQQHWRSFDEDAFVAGWCTLRRGHTYRLFVDGRFEASSVATPSTHGLLAHLPLMIHPAPRRVAIVGASTAAAVRAATSHPVERIDVFDVARVPFRAAARLAPDVRIALQDPRVAMHPGDPRGLLRRSEPYDVILGQVSGVWTDRSARATTASFLRVVRDRLTPDGLYCHWIPASSLTREGFLTLLATLADVFPQVECWAGEGAAVVVLAKRTASPHGFDSILASYGNEGILRDARQSWIGSPETMLARFLVGDAHVRAIAAGRPVHDVATPALGRPEADRRRREPRVNPVPGLTSIADPPTSILAGAPPGLEMALVGAREARALQAEALDLELEGDNLAAAAVYRRALDMNPNDGSIRRALATLRTQMGIRHANAQAVTAAHSYMREAVEVDSTFASGFANLGWLLLRAKSFDYAISCTRQAIELAPNDDLFALQLGRIWKLRDQLDKALPWYERAMTINPRNVEAAIGYVDTKLAMQTDPDLREGLDVLLEYAELEPEHEDLRNRISRLRTALRGEP